MTTEGRGIRVPVGLMTVGIGTTSSESLTSLAITVGRGITVGSTGFVGKMTEGIGTTDVVGLITVGIGTTSATAREAKRKTAMEERILWYFSSKRREG